MSDDLMRAGSMGKGSMHGAPGLASDSATIMRDAAMSDVLMQARDIQKWFALGGGLFAGKGTVLKAVDGVSLDIRRNEVLSVVGESGSGKTTLGRVLTGLLPATGGSILFEGQDITHLSRSRMRPLRQRIQMVFQDPYASLNARHTIEDIIAAPLDIHQRGLTRQARRKKVEEALSMVGLLPQHAQRYPHEFSGGQRQRVGIARALISRPQLLVADEPVSALDVSIQAQVVNLLLELKEQLGLSILFIAHDLSVVGHISDRIAVMYLGRIVEMGGTLSIFSKPGHPYTEALLSAAPIPDPALKRQRIVLEGDIPSPVNPPSGCTFRTRCRYAEAACAQSSPSLSTLPGPGREPGQLAACRRTDLTLQSIV